MGFIKCEIVLNWTKNGQVILSLYRLCNLYGTTIELVVSESAVQQQDTNGRNKMLNHVKIYIKMLMFNVLMVGTKNGTSAQILK